MKRYTKANEKLLYIYRSNSVKAQGYALNHKEETTETSLGKRII